MLSEIGEKRTWDPSGSSTSQYVCSYYTDYMFQEPGGGRHALDVAIAQPAGNADCVSNMPEFPASVLSGGDDFYRAVVLPWTGTGPTPVTVAGADGTVYKFSNSKIHTLSSSNASSALPDFAEDRNGNKVVFSDTGNGSFTMTDTAGRAAILSSGFGHSGNTVAVTGLGAPYTVEWGTATSDYGVDPAPVGLQSSECEPIPAVAGNQQVITAITLPNGQSYTFQYDPTYGLLDRITYPTGAYVRYVWGLDSDSGLAIYQDAKAGGCAEQYGSAAVVKRFVSFDGVHEGVHEAEEQDFTYSTGPLSDLSWTSKQSTVVTHDLARGVSFKAVYNYLPYGVPRQPDEPLEISDGVPVENTVTTYDFDGDVLQTVAKSWQDQYLMTCQSTTQGGLTSRTDYSYSEYGGQVTDEKEWDWGQAPACGSSTSVTPGRETATAYANFAATPIYPGAASIFDRPASIVTYGSGSRAAETDYAYDAVAVSRTSGLTGHDYTNYSSSYNNRGNATSRTQWLNAGGSSPVTTYTYDDTGHMLTTKDPNGNTTSYSYADSYASGSPPGPTDAYLTQIVYPNTGAAHVVKFSYNYASGDLASSTDQNNQLTAYSYGDPLGRLTEIKYPDAGETQYSYDDSVPSVTMTKSISPSTIFSSTTVMDGAGHPIQTQITSDPSGTVFTDTTYDGLGRVFTKSNPHRAMGSSTDGITTYT